MPKPICFTQSFALSFETFWLSVLTHKQCDDMFESNAFTDPLVIHGQELHEAGLFNDALLVYNKALKQHPKDSALLLLMGRLQQALGQHDRAVNFLQRSVKADPSNVQAFLQLGISLAAQNRPQEALKAFDRVLELHPDHLEAYCFRGNIFANANKRPQARQAYLRAIEIRDDSASIHYNLGVIEQVDMRPVQAIQHYRRAIQLQPSHASAYCNLSVALCETGEISQAKSCNDMALALDPMLAEAHFNAHTYHLAEGQMDLAITRLRTAHQLNPQHDKYRVFLGVLLDYTGDIAQALPLLTVKKPSAHFAADVQAWQYLRRHNPLPTMLANSRAVFEYALSRARQDGLVMEFGVFQGTSINLLAKLVPTAIHGFDSFVGIPEDWNDEKAGSYSMKGELPFVSENVQLHVGWFEQSIPPFVEMHDEAVRFMNIDCDLYSSTETVLALFHRQIGQGTVLVFDEFIGNVSWQEDELKAFEHAAQKYGWRYKVICFCFVTKQVAILIT
jgi:tetratricopeptide (TPR) repeat protein